MVNSMASRKVYRKLYMIPLKIACISDRIKEFKKNRSVAEPHIAIHTDWLCNKVKNSFKFFSIIYQRNLATLHSFHFLFSFTVCIYNSIEVDVVNSKHCYFFLSRLVAWLCLIRFDEIFARRQFSSSYTNKIEQFILQKCSRRFCK